MDIIYHNELEIFVNDEIIYKGQVLIYQDNTCEGIMYDKNMNKYFIFGTFEKYVNLDLAIVSDNKIEKFKAKKAYLKYKGEYTKISETGTSKTDFYLTASSLNKDPRDYWDDSPRQKFSKEKNEFKKHWLENNYTKNLQDNSLSKYDCELVDTESLSYQESSYYSTNYHPFVDDDDMSIPENFDPYQVKIKLP